MCEDDYPKRLLFERLLFDVRFSLAEGMELGIKRPVWR